jgi:AraC family transcriptional regulator
MNSRRCMWPPQPENNAPRQVSGWQMLLGCVRKESRSKAPIISGAVTTAVIKLLADADKAFDADRAAARSCIAQATALLRAEGKAEPPVRDSLASGRSGLAPWQVNRVKAYVEDNLDAPIQVGTLASISRLSRSYFSTAFKRSLGETLHAYLTRRRLARAQQLMLMTDRALSRIALDCGFCDQAHLSRVFRRTIGVPPNKWRRQRLADSM